MTFLTSAVRDSRLGMMRDLMDRLRLDALILTTADFFQFATNFLLDVQPWERPVMVLIPRDGGTRAIMNELSTHHLMMARERDRVWLDDVQFYAEHPRVADRHYLLPQLPEMATELLKTSGLGFSRIGLDGVPGFLSRAA